MGGRRYGWIRRLLLCGRIRLRRRRRSWGLLTQNRSLDAISTKAKILGKVAVYMNAPSTRRKRVGDTRPRVCRSFLGIGPARSRFSTIPRRRSHRCSATVRFGSKTMSICGAVARYLPHHSAQNGAKSRRGSGRPCRRAWSDPDVRLQHSILSIPTQHVFAGLQSLDHRKVQIEIANPVSVRRSPTSLPEARSSM